MICRNSVVLLLFTTLACFQHVQTGTYNDLIFGSNTFRYPVGILPCKLFRRTSLDCCHRQLIHIPPLFGIHTEQVYLNNNNLTNLTGTPFGNVSNTRLLDLSNNVLAVIEPRVFHGLANLNDLDLSHNRIFVLPRHVFRDLVNLTRLNLHDNILERVPNEAISPITSLQIALLSNNNFKSIEIGTGFRNLTNLHKLWINNRDSMIRWRHLNNESFQNLAGCKLLKDFQFGTAQIPFVPRIFENITRLETLIVAPSIDYAELESLDSPLRSLTFLPHLDSETVTRETFQLLSKWNSTLLTLRFISGRGSVRKILGSAFSWVPLLRTLYISNHDISYLSADAFNGLTRLETLNLANNNLESVLDDTFYVFRESNTLVTLDLRFNKLFSVESTMHSLVILSLKNLFLYGNPGVLMNSSTVLPLVNLTYLSVAVTELSENCPPVMSLRTLRLQTSSMFYRPFKTTVCTLAPHLTRALLPNLLIRRFNEVIGDLCLRLTELDISGCLNKYTSQPNIELPNLTTLNMARNKLTSMSQINFIKSVQLLHLDLSFNDISFLDNTMIMTNNLRSLVWLNMQGNMLTSMTGIDSMSFLTYLNLAQNKITRATNINFPYNATAIDDKDFILDLSGNPFHCTCDIVPFKQWITKDDIVHLVANKQYTCATPTSQVRMSITDVVQDCRGPLLMSLGISIPGALVVAFLGILAIKYRWHIKYKLFLLIHKRRIRHHGEYFDDAADNNFSDGNILVQNLQTYDAYVVYNDSSEQDTRWVINELRPNLEDEHHIRLYIKDRDSIPGRDIFDETCENIQRSHKTLLILTPRFVESEWCHFEMRMAQMRLFEDNRDVIVLVLLEDIPDDGLTMSLRQLLCDKELLKFPRDRLGQGLFWKRLKTELMEQVIVDRRYDV